MPRLLGNPKEKETLAGLLLNTRVVQLKLGRIDVRFQKPFSLKAYLAEQKLKREEKPKKGNAKTEQAILLKALGYQVLSDINQCSVVSSFALLLNLFFSPTLTRFAFDRRSCQLLLLEVSC